MFSRSQASKYVSVKNDQYQVWISDHNITMVDVFYPEDQGSVLSLSLSHCCRISDYPWFHHHSVSISDYLLSLSRYLYTFVWILFVLLSKQTNWLAKYLLSIIEKMFFFKFDSVFYWIGEWYMKKHIWMELPDLSNFVFVYVFVHICICICIWYVYIKCKRQDVLMKHRQLPDLSARIGFNDQNITLIILLFVVTVSDVSKLQSSKHDSQSVR